MILDWIFRFRAKCKICGKRAFAMHDRNNIYCKRHWKQLKNTFDTKSKENKHDS